MKPLFVAILAEIICFIFVTAFLRLFQPKNRVKTMLCAIMLALPFLFYIHLCFPGDLGFLPEWMTTSNDAVDLAFSIFLYFAGFFGGTLQLYNLADRGFSLRILIDIYESPDKGMNVDEVINNYSRGKGIAWMYNKRIQDMLSEGLVVVHDDIIRNCSKGEKVAKLFAFLRAVFNFPLTHRRLN